MKKLIAVIVFALILWFIPKALAQTSVDISNNGEGATSEVHVENSEGETTVCINGKCETTTGNVDRQEGGAKVKIENNVGQVAGQSATPTPIVEDDASKSAESSISAKKDEAKEQQSSFEELMNSIRNFIGELFSQNN